MSSNPNVHETTIERCSSTHIHSQIVVYATILCLFSVVFLSTFYCWCCNKLNGCPEFVMRTVLRKRFLVVSFVRAILTGFGVHFCLEIGEIVSLHETLVNRHGSISLFGNFIKCWCSYFAVIVILCIWSHYYYWNYSLRLKTEEMKFYSFIHLISRLLGIFRLALKNVEN